MKIIRYFPLANMQSHRIHLFIFPLFFSFWYYHEGWIKRNYTAKIISFFTLILRTNRNWDRNVLEIELDVKWICFASGNPIGKVTVCFLLNPLSTTVEFNSCLTPLSVFFGNLQKIKITKEFAKVINTDLRNVITYLNKN